MIKSSKFNAGKDTSTWSPIAWMNLLSLDVVAGSLLSGMFAAHVLKTSPGWAYWAVLAISVWIIYTLDHLVDATRLRENAHTPRHLFAYKNINFLVGAIGVLTVLDAYLVLSFMEKEVLFYGLSLGALVLVYFLVLHHASSRQSILVQKEIIVALVYTAGVWGIPVMYAEAFSAIVLVILVAGFIVLALMNTLLLAIRDRDTDLLDNHPSFALKMGRIYTRRTVCFLGGLVFLISLILMVFLSGEYLAAAIIYGIMATCMMGLSFLSETSDDELLFRLLTELVFWLPGLMLVF